MPELPEVETVRRGLAPVMEGATIVKAVARRPDLRFALPRGFARRLTGRRIAGLSRRAKYLLASLDSGETLIMHLGMSGSFRVHGQDGAPETPGNFHYPRAAAEKHDHVVLLLQRDNRRHAVVYNDPRRFGFMDLVASGDLGQCRHLRDLGIEPAGDELDAAAIARLFAGKQAPVKAALLDQRLIAGLGNIYACEALWQAGISPLRAAGSLVAANGMAMRAAGRLAQAIRDVMAAAIAAGGSSLRDHKLVDGSLGYFQQSFNAYEREGEACPRPGCGGTIRRTVQAGRSTFHCRRCQR